MYKVLACNAVRKDLKKLSYEVRQMVKQKYLPILEQDPYVGLQLQYEFKGLWSYHFSEKGVDYRIVYEIYPEKKLVVLILIGKREKFYEQLKRRIK